MVSDVTGVRSRLLFSWVHRPFTLLCGIIFAPVGALALVFGVRVSTVLTTLDIPNLSRALGGVLFVGGVLVLYGMAKELAVVESMGLAFVATGCALFVVFAVLALGLHGALIAAGYTIISIGAVRRLVTLARHAPVLGDDD